MIYTNHKRVFTNISATDYSHWNPLEGELETETAIEFEIELETSENELQRLHEVGHRDQQLAVQTQAALLPRPLRRLHAQAVQDERGHLFVQAVVRLPSQQLHHSGPDVAVQDQLLRRHLLHQPQHQFREGLRRGVHSEGRSQALLAGGGLQ